MSGLNTAMDTSLSALFAAQVGMSTTGHNIANANSAGYSRQQVMTSPRRPVVMPWGSIGRGIDIDSIRRVQDEFLAKNLRVQVSRLSSYAAVDSALAEVEGILGSVDNDQIGSALTDFFSAWNSLSQASIQDDLKANVVTMAQNLAQVMHSIDDSLTDLEENIELSLQGEVANLNSMLTEVGNLNEQIMGAETSGQPANDLRDRRDNLMLQISDLAEVTTVERGDGSLDVILAGRTVVARGSVTHFETIERRSGDGGSQSVIVTMGTNRDVALPPGKLQGLLESRDVHVDQVRDSLNEVARKLIDEVNALHNQGRTTQSGGLAFFTGDSLHTIDVNPALVDRPSLVATGRTSAESDNDLALAIANLMNESVDGANAETVGDVYRGTLIGVASKRASFQFMVDNQQNMVESLEAKVASVSGVSLDEEGANMMKYQNTYTAAARVITVVQDMYDTLLNMV
jgi:flagellar hook-associated protein 1 FlgK